MFRLWRTSAVPRFSIRAALSAFVLLQTGCLAQSEDNPKFSITSSADPTRESLSIAARFLNNDTKALCILNISIYPSHELDPFGHNTFDNIVESPSSRSLNGNVWAIRVDPSSSQVFSYHSRRVQISSIDVALMGGTEQDQLNFNSSLRELASRGTYKIMAELFVSYCPDPATTEKSDGILRQRLSGNSSARYFKYELGEVSLTARM